MDAYNTCLEARRQLVAHAIVATHSLCPDEFVILNRIGFSRYLMDACDRYRHSMVLLAAPQLPVRAASLEAVMRTFASMAQRHGNPQLALDAHFAAKVVIRQFLAVANTPGIRTQWAAQGRLLSMAVATVLVNQIAA